VESLLPKTQVAVVTWLLTDMLQRFCSWHNSHCGWLYIKGSVYWQYEHTTPPN